MSSKKNRTLDLINNSYLDIIKITEKLQKENINTKEYENILKKLSKMIAKNNKKSKIMRGGAIVLGEKAPQRGSLVNDNPVNGQPFKGHPVNGQPFKGHPVNGQPVKGQPVNGLPVGSSNQYDSKFIVQKIIENNANYNLQVVQLNGYVMSLFANMDLVFKFLNREYADLDIILQPISTALQTMIENYKHLVDTKYNPANSKATTEALRTHLKKLQKNQESGVKPASGVEPASGGAFLHAPSQNSADTLQGIFGIFFSFLTEIINIIGTGMLLANITNQTNTLISQYVNQGNFLTPEAIKLYGTAMSQLGPVFEQLPRSVPGISVGHPEDARGISGSFTPPIYQPRVPQRLL